MSDKFFDKDNNFILWKDKGDLTEASKYVGDNRSSIGVGESLVTKIAKGKVDIGRTYGLKSMPLTVNWGKCGGSDDVIVTYGADEGLWIPRDFMLTAFDTNGEIITSNLPNGDDVGYVGYLGDTDGSTSVLVYLLPKTIGKYLYENAESLPTKEYYGEDTASNAKRAYKGIAMYPNTVTSTNGWTSSISWGIGIRQRWDVTVEGHKNTGDFSYTYKSNIYGTLKDEEYYLVSQSFNNTENSLKGQLSIFNQNDTGSDHMWLRHFSTMTRRPHWSEGATSWTQATDDPTNVGEKYIYKGYGVIERALTVNWGKCGGSSDVIVEYKEGEGFWIPSAFLASAFNSNGNILPNVSKVPDVGYVGAGYGSHGIAIYKLPQKLGEQLYKDSISMPGVIYYGLSGKGVQGMVHKAFAMYPDHIGTDTTSDWTDSSNWGIGIRKKSDIWVMGEDAEGSLVETSFTQNSVYSLLDDNSYYLVSQFDASVPLTMAGWHLQGQLSLFNIDDKGTDHLWLRHFENMSSQPSADNKGAKYTIPSELCNKDNFTLTETKDSITVNWGKCGGNEDVIVNYNVGEGIWVPKEFLFFGKTMAELLAYNGDKLYLSDNVTKDTSVGYKTWFSDSDYGDRTERGSRINYWINVYKLPQEFGEWLYKNAEDNLGTHSDYSSSNSAGYSGVMEHNYKGIALYPDTLDNGDWTNSNGWGVGIRKKEDLCVVGYYNGSKSTKRGANAWDISCIENYSQYKALEDDAYYLVAHCAKATASDKYNLALNPFDYFGENKAYLRHYNTMTVKPDGGENMGKKYTVTSDMVTTVYTLPTPNEDQVEIDWGAGIKTYYKYGEPMYIPRAFLMEGYVVSSNGTYSPSPNRLWLDSEHTIKDTSVGYKTYLGCEDYSGVRRSSTLWIGVYKLPQEIGEYLYNRAESNLGEHDDYSSTKSSSSSSNQLRNYKGIATYPDEINTNWNTSKEWGVGIRKKSDLNILGMDSTTGLPSTKQTSAIDYVRLAELDDYMALEDDAYYLVAQTGASDSIGMLGHQLTSLFPKDEPIWMRHFKNMTSAPSSTNMGKKMLYHPEHGKSALGGKIFYIDPSDNGATYTFFDEDFNEINNWSTISDLANAKYYSVKGTPSKDKFYVYYPTKHDSLKWGYDSTSIGATGSTIGTGKTNTEKVMSRTDIPTGTIWSKLSEIRTSSGLSDLFIPSKDEIDKFRVADLEPWHSDSYLWSSSEYSTQTAWLWNYGGRLWYYNGKYASTSVFFTRSF